MSLFYTFHLQFSLMFIALCALNRFQLVEFTKYELNLQKIPPWLAL